MTEPYTTLLAFMALGAALGLIFGVVVGSIARRPPRIRLLRPEFLEQSPKILPVAANDAEAATLKVPVGALYVTPDFVLQVRLK